MRKMTFLQPLFVVSALACVTVSRGIAADVPTANRPADLAPVLKPILEQHHAMPGLIAAIVDGERISAIGAVGVRKAGAPEKMTVGDVIHLGSDTKAMTATLIGKLIREQAVGIQHADVRNLHRPAPRDGQVTVRQLLDHTAGLPANVDWWKFDGTKKPLREQRRMVVEEVLKKAPEHPPGAKYVYSNIGFVVLGAILEHKTEMPWEQLMEKELFEPLGMKSAGFGPPGTLGKIDEPWGHTLKDGQAVADPVRQCPGYGTGRTGALLAPRLGESSSVCIYSRPRGNIPILRPKTIEELITPESGKEYAGGWIITSRPWAGGLTLNHAGSNTMWFCVAWLAPKKHFAVLVATNVAGDDAEKACDEAAAALIDFHSKHSNER